MNILLKLPISYYGVAAFVNFLTCVAIIALVVAQKRDSKLVLLFCNFTAMIAIWSLCYSIWMFSSQREVAEFWLRTDMVLVSFLPPTFLHFVAELIKSRLRPWVHMLNYAVGGLIASIMYTDMFATSVSAPFLVFPYWLKPGILFPVHLAYFFAGIGAGHLMMLRIMRSETSSTALKKKVSIVFWGTLIGFGSGITNYLSWYRLPVPPVTMPTVSFYVVALAYAVIKHQLMDIQVIIRRSFVYSLLVTIFTIIYLTIVVLSEHLFRFYLGYRSVLIAVFTSAIFALVFNPVRARLQNFIDRYFYKLDPEKLLGENTLMKSELQKSEKMKAVATLAAGMAHEIKNPLAAICTFTEYLPKKYDDPEFREKFCRIIGQEVGRIRDIVTNLLLFSRPADPIKKVCSANDALKDILELLTNEFIKSNIRVNTEFQDHGILADPGQLKQALLNIILNAIDAMKERGGELAVSSSLVSGNWILVSIKDTGIGIPKDKIPRLFDPFYTDKEGGTGLGLAITHSVIEKNGGKIKVESEVGKGTEFIITFPAV